VCVKDKKVLLKGISRNVDFVLSRILKRQNPREFIRGNIFKLDKQEDH